MVIKTFREKEFINRDKEIEFFKDYFESVPDRIMWVYGPKSTGKTTLIEYIIENKLLPTKKYWIKYINLRGLFVTNYDKFIYSFFEESEGEDDFNSKGEIGVEFNLGVIKINSKIFKAIKEKKINLFDELINGLKKIDKKKIIIIDEIQTLEDIYLNGEKLLLHEFLNFCVRLTKELHLSHIVILTSNTLFLNTIYQNAKLKETSRFKLINHLEYNDIKEWLKTKNFSKEEIDLIYEYLGGSATRISKMLRNYKYHNSLRDYLEQEVKLAKNEVLYMLKIQKDDEIKIDFKTIIKDIVDNGYFIDNSLDDRYLKVIKIFSDVEILFYDPINNITLPNSKIYQKGFEAILKEQSL